MPASAVACADAWALGATVVNEGTAAADASRLAYWYSSDGVLDAGDVLIGTSTIPPLAPGATAADVWSDTYTIADSGGSSGTHHIFVVADADSSLSEPDKANNTKDMVVAVVYERIVIDTYRPKPSVIFANTFLSLFGSSGDPTAETGLEMWNGNVSPFTVDAPPVSLAEDDDGNLTFFGCARIDYTGGLAPGTYYVRIRGERSTSTGVYAVRLLRPAIGEDIEGYGGWYFPATSDDASFEPDNDPASGGAPSNPVPIAFGQKLNRALTTTTEPDVDWLVFTLP